MTNIRQLSIDFDIPPEPVSSMNEEGTGCPARITLEDLFLAYFDCRKHKRKTANALKFEMDYEESLIRLCDEINNGTYQIGRSISFIVDHPVKREIFAADFRDRIVHHLIMSKVGHIFEKEFVYDSYSCRKNRGTLFGVKRLNRFIRSCSQNYTKDCYVLKMDIQGFFMSIDKEKLLDMIFELVGCNYHEPDKDLLMGLIRQVVMNDCTNNCHIKSPLSFWNGLPSNKSLFGNDEKMGLPIGNYTSQVFANFYLGKLDHFIKSDLGIRYYSRYVDDFVMVHNDKEHLKSLIPVIETFLKEKLGLNLHPRKIVLQHYEKGVKFTGAYIMPGRIYIERRTKGGLYQKIANANKKIRQDPTGFSKEEREHLFASVNSYLGFMRHYKTFKLRKKMLKQLSARFDKYYRPAAKYTKLKKIDS